MVILGVDYGDVRTGVAVCDKNEMLASPVGVITQRRPDLLAAELARIASACGADHIVMGLPRNMDGSEGFRAEAVREFADMLRIASGLQVVLRDERLSTAEAHKVLSMNDVRGKKRKESVDALSAVLILEDYLGFRKRGQQ